MSLARLDDEPPDVPADVDPPFELGETGADLYRATRPLAFADAEHGWAWAHLLAALSQLLDVIATMVRDDEQGNPGWTALASPNRCPEPWLRVLAQWAGVRRWDAMSSTDLRNLIGPTAPGLWRGTRLALRAAVRRFLPPDATIYFEERAVTPEHPEGDPYHLRVFTYDFDEHDPEQVHEAILAALPAGLTLDYQVRHGQTYRMLRDRHPDYASVRDSYENYGDVRDRNPIPGSEERA